MLAFIDVHRLVDRQVDNSILVIIIAHGHDLGLGRSRSRESSKVRQSPSQVESKGLIGQALFWLLVVDYMTLSLSCHPYILFVYSA
jgi:hypothetical protein